VEEAQVSFFGGEPFLRLEAMQRAVARARAGADARGSRRLLQCTNRGQLLWTRRAYADRHRHASPALADLTGDGVPEIVMQTNAGVSVWRGDDEPLPGWPVAYAEIGEVYSDMGSSAPAIGDVDGDLSPDVVFASQTTSSSRLYAHASDGVPLEGFPVEIEGCEARAPAIADIDLDGRNEIIVGGDAWEGIGGDMSRPARCGRRSVAIAAADALWVYDLGGESHGRIEWGQLGGDARHRFVYPVPPPKAPQRGPAFMGWPPRSGRSRSGSPAAWHRTVRSTARS
jgi:hypothetical protein